MSEEKKPTDNSKMVKIIGIIGAIVIVVLIAISIASFNKPKKSEPSVVSTPNPAVDGFVMDKNQDFVDNFKNTPTLPFLNSAIDRASLTETLRGGPFTVFAPNNNAFTQLPTGTIETLFKPESKKQLNDLLTYHVLAGSFEVEDFKDGQELVTLNGAKLKVKKDSNGTMVGNAKILVSNIIQKNGVAHIIDTVLTPETATTKITTIGDIKVPSDQNFADSLATIPTLSTVAKAVEAGGLTSTLKMDGPFTVFAPSNDAFNKLPPGALENLLKPENRAQLISVLTYHVLPGKILVTNLKDGQELITLNGTKLKVKVNGTKVSLIGGQSANNIATIETSDVIQSNGVAHIIDNVLFPAAK